MNWPTDARQQAFLRVLAKTYQSALADPDARIPTRLCVMLETIVRAVDEHKSEKGLHNIGA